MLTADRSLAAALAYARWFGWAVFPVGGNDTATRIIGHLLRRWVDPELAYVLIGVWNAVRCQPPLPQDELARTFNSVLGCELKRRETA